MTLAGSDTNYTECLACRGQNCCFDLKIDAEIDAPSAIRGKEAHTGLTTKSFLHKNFIYFLCRKKERKKKITLELTSLFVQIWHHILDRYGEFLLHALVSTTTLLHIQSLIAAQCNHSCPLTAAEQLGAKFLRACTSAVVFKRGGESVTHSVSPTGLVHGFEPCLIDFIAFTAP